MYNITFYTVSTEQKCSMHNNIYNAIVFHLKMFIHTVPTNV